MKLQHFHIIILALILFVVSCNSKKEIDLKLPPYKPQYLVECYLTPNEPFRLLLSQSSGIESSIPLNPLVLADVRVFHKSDTILFDDLPIIDTSYYKAYNYVSNSIVEYDTVNPYFLEIRIRNSNDVLRAQTKFLKRPKINKIGMSTINGTDISLNLSIDDVSKIENNYYYFMIIDSLKKYDFEVRPRNSALFDDKLITDGKVAIYTSYKYNEGESLLARVYNITKDHYDFLASVDEAQNANGNPFGRPTFLVSNVSGAVGIFTALNFDEKKLVVSVDSL
jgi:hypothetical protein